ncbi:MAG TPA: response regulator [Thermoanaerobaculia bacterium]|nr:response regulator [Thermoanaerobaculia bacterium]
MSSDESATETPKRSRRKKTLDATDLKIVQLLQRDARMTVESIARSVGLTKTPTALRLRRLQSEGIITSFHAHFDSAAVGLHLTVFLQVVLNDSSAAARSVVERMLISLPFVLECHRVTSGCDLLVKLKVASLEDLQREVLTPLSKTGAVSHCHSILVLSTSKEECSVALKRRRSDNLRVLVVDDDELVRTTLAAVFEEEGIDVVTAGGGEEAISCIGEEAFDAAVVDLMMPEVDGMQVISYIRSGRRLGCVYVVTGDVSLAERIAPHVCAVLPKPFDPEMLADKIRHCAH